MEKIVVWVISQYGAFIAIEATNALQKLIEYHN